MKESIKTFGIVMLCFLWFTGISAAMLAVVGTMLYTLFICISLGPIWIGLWVAAFTGLLMTGFYILLGHFVGSAIGNVAGSVRR